MIKKIITSILLVATLILVVSCGSPEPKVPTPLAYPAEDLSQAEIDALRTAIIDEYKAEALYANVLSQFGNVAPFSNIVTAEKRHSDELIILFEKYHLEIPFDSYVSIEKFTSLQEACAKAVEGENANIAMYDELNKNINNDDIKSVFLNLQFASRRNHLPAFERCAMN